MQVVVSILLFLFSSFASAKPLVEGRRLIHSCGYYSSVEGQFRIQLGNQDVPPGSQPILHYGLSGLVPAGGPNFNQNKRIDWVFPGEPFTRFKEVGFSQNPNGIWVAEVGHQVAARSSPETYDRIQFVIAFEFPNQTRSFLRGGNSALGYYEADLAKVTGECVPRDEEVKFQSLPTSEIEKN